MHLNRLRLAGASLAVAAVTLLPATPAHALTEARISSVSCQGFTVTQRGLPPATSFRLRAFNPANLRVLATVRHSSGTRGRLQVRFDVPLKGLQRLDVEVDRVSDDAEFGEAGVDLRLHCGGRIEAAPPAVGAGFTGAFPAHAAADRREAARASDRRRQVLLATSIAGVVVASGLLVLRTRRRRRS